MLAEQGTTSVNCMNNLLDSLNDAQRAAVTYDDGPMLVLAGAGSGKTRVLTYKIAWLMAQGISPWSIMALTFTNKAAREMNERIAAITGMLDMRAMWSGTFHSIFARLLRIEHAHTPYTPDYTIYDATDSRNLIKTIVKEMGLNEKQYKPNVVAGRISEAKNALIMAGEYGNDPLVRDRDRADGLPQIAKIYATYQARLLASDAMDFDDLLLQTYVLFDQHPDVALRYRERFAYILVDEFQDTNVAQSRILAKLTTPTSHITVVGDDAQSIYAFRGAKIDNILNFTQHYAGAKVVKLECNYRSTHTIVEAANSLIRHNHRQLEKKVYSVGQQGEPLTFYAGDSEKDEAQFVLGHIQRLHKSQGVDYNDIAILYRTNAQSRSFEDVFRTYRLPYRIYGGLSFYQRKEVKDVIAYCRLVVNPRDEEAFKRVVNYPARGIGATTIGHLQVAAVAQGVTLPDVAADPQKYGVKVTPAATRKLALFFEMIGQWRALHAKTPGHTLAQIIVQQSGIMADLLQDVTIEGKSRVENVDELISAIAIREEEAKAEGREFVPLSDYLSQVSLLTDADERDDGTPKVTLMTIHAAKGLEFEAVYVTGMEDKLFPNANAQFNPREMEEERRLFYVALTRAKTHCTLTMANCRFRYGEMDFCEPSPFLMELPGKYVKDDSRRRHRMLWSSSPMSPKPAAKTAPATQPKAEVLTKATVTPPTVHRTPKSPASYPARTGERQNDRWLEDWPQDWPEHRIDQSRYQRPTHQYDPLTDSSASPRSSASQSSQPSAPDVRRLRPVAAVRPAAAKASAPQLAVGDRIVHDRFGRGVVVALEGEGDAGKARIDFEQVGVKTLLMKFAQITRNK